MNIMQAKELIKKVFYMQVETGNRFTIELESGPGMALVQLTRPLSSWQWS